MTLQEGRFKAVAEAFAFGTASTGTEQIGITFSVHYPSGTEYETWYGYLSEAAAERTIKTLQTLGWKGVNMDEIQLADIRNEVELDIGYDKQKPDQLRILWINGGPGVAMKDPMTPAQKKDLSARMRGLCMQLGGSSKPPTRPQAARPAPAPAPRPAATPAPRPAAATSSDLEPDPDYPIPDDDDIPF